ncbi:hypothetical protein ACFL3A_02980, partial [Pseudomonadota bacterium]
LLSFRLSLACSQYSQVCLLLPAEVPGQVIRSYTPWKEAREIIEECFKEQNKLESQHKYLVEEDAVIKQLVNEIIALRVSSRASEKKRRQFDSIFKEKGFEEMEYSSIKLYDAEFAAKKLHALRVRIAMRLEETRKVCRRLQREAQRYEALREDKVQERINADDLRGAQNIIKQLKPGQGRDALQNSLNEKIKGKVDEINVAIEDCRLLRPRSKLPSAYGLLYRLPEGYPGNEKLKWGIDAAITREEEARKHYKQAWEYWEQARDKRKLNNYREALGLGKQSHRSLIEAIGKTKCRTDKKTWAKYLEQVQYHLQGLEAAIKGAIPPAVGYASDEVCESIRAECTELARAYFDLYRSSRTFGYKYISIGCEKCFGPIKNLK